MYLFDKELQFPRCIGREKGGGGGREESWKCNRQIFFFFSICKKPLRLFLHYTNKLFTIQEVYYRDRVIYIKDGEKFFFFFFQLFFFQPSSMEIALLGLK